jgi:hypothetical protein
MSYQQGLLLPSAVSSYLPKTQFGIAQLWFVNRTPLISRLPKAPVGNIKFDMVGYKFRPRTVALAATITNNATTIGLVDASSIMNGDVLLLSSGEAVEVTAAPSGNNITVRRGIGTTQTGQTVVAGTAIADITGDLATAKVIGNSRTGGEIDQIAISQIPSVMSQYVQTFQHVVQVSGVMQDIQGFPWPAATPGPFAKNKMDAMQNFMDDVEYTSLYGVGEALGGANTRPKQYGITNLLSTNKDTATNPSAYKPVDFMGDTMEKIWSNGGNPSVIFASVSFMTGLATWGGSVQRLSAGVTPFGTDIQVFYSPFIGPVPIIPNMWLAPGSVLVLTQEEVRFRILKEPVYEPYGRRGDTGSAANNGEGDWIGRLAVEVDNEAHHAYVSGITGFAPAA